jgi:CheY-like chemotaxis protein
MILVVEDHADTRKALVRLLAIEGYTALAVETGSQALALLREHRPRLVLLDFGLPDISGLDVFRHMRKTPALAGIPVIMFSAFTGTQRQQAIDAGVDGYVIKGSLDWPRLVREIARLAGLPSSPGQLQSDLLVEGTEGR